MRLHEREPGAPCARESRGSRREARGVGRAGAEAGRPDEIRASRDEQQKTRRDQDNQAASVRTTRDWCDRPRIVPTASVASICELLGSREAWTRRVARDDMGRHTSISSSRLATPAVWPRNIPEAHEALPKLGRGVAFRTRFASRCRSSQRRGRAYGHSDTERTHSRRSGSSHSHVRRSSRARSRYASLRCVDTLKAY